MNEQILAVIPYYSGDVERTKNLLNWISESRARYTCPALLVVDDDVPQETRNEVRQIADKSFNCIGTIPAQVSCVWKPNQMFLSAAKWISECCRVSWLWLENDCVPVSSAWIQEIEMAYYTQPKKFMGPFIRQTKSETLPTVHMTGCAIYPNDAWELYRGMEALRTQNVAWDIHAADAVIPRAQDTNLIHHHWGTKDMPPEFVEARTETSPQNHVTLDFIRKDAVLFHRSKSEGLINLLRKKREKECSDAMDATQHPTIAKRRPGRPPKIREPKVLAESAT